MLIPFLQSSPNELHISEVMLFQDFQSCFLECKLLQSPSCHDFFDFLLSTIVLNYSFQLIFHAGLPTLVGLAKY